MWAVLANALDLYLSALAGPDFYEQWSQAQKPNALSGVVAGRLHVWEKSARPSPAGRVQSTGKLYFDVVGAPPNSVVYNAEVKICSSGLSETWSLGGEGRWTVLAVDEGVAGVSGVRQHGRDIIPSGCYLRTTGSE